jgi:VWFA-related protein
MAPAQTQAQPQQSLPTSNNAAQPSATDSVPPAANPAQPAAAPQAQPSVPLGQDDNQAPVNGQGDVFVFKKEVHEVILHATVVDKDNHLVTTLDGSAFSVFENGVPQVITSFRREDAPVAMGIVIDNSGSMREKREKIREAVLNLISVSNPKDEMFVVNFSQNSYLDQDFTSDAGLIRQALQQVSSQGETALYDAIVASAVHLKNNPRVERKALLVITDGQDNSSQETLQQAARRLQQENGPVVYAIGLTGDGMKQSGHDALQTLAESTGGVAFFTPRLEEVDSVTRTIARDIRSQYTIGYKPTSARENGGYRRIQVQVRARNYRDLTARTRNGYYPGESLH